ncbi:pilus assembly protein TadG-related protein [Vibrio comitans]
MEKQKGVAAIVVALSFLAVGGMIQLSVEGTRMIQEQHRLADAAEAATLAVAISNRKNSEASDALARSYLETYMPNIDINTVKVLRTEGNEEVDGNKLYYVQYEVEADASFDSWFNFSDHSSTELESRRVGNDAMARTHMLPSDLDLVFVADFSGSMNSPWNGKSQLQHLKDQVNIISSDLLSSTATSAGYAHRIGFVPYNLRTQESINGDRRCITQLEYEPIEVTTKYQYWNGYRWVWRDQDHLIPFESIDWKTWGEKSSSEVRNCADESNYCSGFMTQQEAKAIRKVFSSAGGNWPDAHSYVDIDISALNWNVSKISAEHLHPVSSKSGSNLFSNGMCGGSENFFTIPLSLQKPSIDSMSASGGTSVYQGLIRGAQVLAEGRSTIGDTEQLEKYNERAQMLLILSDGKEDPFTETFSELVEKGLCTNIRQHFSDHDSPLYIGVIGINFNASGQTGFKNCADEIIDVSNSQDLLDKIQELIQKGAATNGVSRLYDKNS